MSPSSSDRRRDDAGAEADALVAREYEALKPEIVATVAAKLTAGGVRLDAADLDAAYNQGWHAVHVKLAEGEQVDNLRGLLVSIVHRRALDEYRALRPGRRAAAAPAEELVDEGATDAAVDEQLDAGRRLRAFVEGLRDRLDPRERQAAALCYLYGFSRPEAAQALGVAPKRMEKVMDAVSRRLAPVVGEIEAGAWCESRASLIKAYALGLLEEDGERHRLARDHLAECPACRLHVLRLRGLAAVAPPAPVVAGLTGGAVVGTAAAAGEAGHGGGVPDLGGVPDAMAANTATASPVGAVGAGGATGAGHAVARETRTKLVVAGAVAGAVAVAAAVLAVALGGGGGDDTPAPPVERSPAQAQRADQARAAAAVAARRRAAARRAAARRAAARRAAIARRRAEARRRAAAASAPAVAAQAPAVAQPPPADPPVAEPLVAEPAPPPVAETPPAADPPRAPDQAPAAADPPPPADTGPPVRDGAEEFDLR